MLLYYWVLHHILLGLASRCQIILKPTPVVFQCRSKYYGAGAQLGTKVLVNGHSETFLQWKHASTAPALLSYPNFPAVETCLLPFYPIRMDFVVNM